MASLQVASVRALVPACSLLGRARSLGQKQIQCPSAMCLPSLSRSYKVLAKSSQSSFTGARFSGEPLGLVKALRTRSRHCTVRASEGREAARDVERRSKNIFENIVDFFKSIISAILGFFSSILNGIARLFRSNEGSARANVRNAGDKVEGAGRDMGNAAQDAADSLGDKGRDAQRNIADGLDDAGSRLKRA